MRRHVVTRLAQVVPSILFLSIFIFALLRVMPGDVTTTILGGGAEGGRVSEEDARVVRSKLGLDQPVTVQYVDWLARALRGDLGGSLYRDETVWDIVGRTGMVTMEVALLSTLIAMIVGVPLGVIAAIYRDTWIDHLARIASVAGLSMPTFWTGTLLILGLATIFDWLPPSFFVESFWKDPLGNLSQFIWPSLVLGYAFAAYITRMTRAQMLETMREDYMRTARSKGLAERVVILRHALRNALLPIVALVGVLFAVLMSGAVIVERIFVLPGLGNALVEAVIQRDIFIVQGIILLIGVSVLLINLLIDVAYGLLDPRVSVR